MAPSSYIDKADIEAGKAVLEAMGYTVIIHPQTHAHIHQSAGTSGQKADAFHDLLKQPKINAIMFAAGGNRALHWADKIDLDLVRAHPKPIMGFSDCTVPLNIISAKTGLVTYYGPTLRWLMTHPNNTLDRAQAIAIFGQTQKSITLDGAEVMRAGSMRGRLVGGTASLMQYLLNDIDFEGKILCLEDWNIETSRLDLLLRAMRRAGVFHAISGLILGTFDNLQDTGRPFGFTLLDILNDNLHGTTCPIVMNAPFGHDERLVTLPIGHVATLDGTTLTLA